MKHPRYLIIIIIALLVVAMATGTFVERANGHEAAASIIYHAPWFIALWGILALVGIGAIVKWKMWKRLWVMLLHVSLLLILVGALVTHLTAREGTLHLRQGATANYYFPADNDQATTLPFTLQLDTFVVAYTPGTAAPRDFESHVTMKTANDTVHAIIRMNHILACQGYRFYQTSYDNDLRGTILTVSYDPVGLPLTYAAYALLALSMMGILFPRLLRKKKQDKTLLLLPLLCLCTLSAAAKEHIPTVNANEAKKMERLQVSGEERVMPLGTLARDFLLSVYGKPTYRGLSAMQVLAGWTLRPEAWKEQPMIRIKSATLRQHLGITDSRYATLAQLFAADGTYRVETFTRADAPEDLRKAAIELDEKVGLIILATRGELVRPTPTSEKVSETRISAELLFNRLPGTLPLFICCFVLAILFFLPEQTKTRRIAGRIKLQTLLNITLAIATCYLTLLYGLRWYIGGHVPLGNGYETMLFMSLCLLCIALCAALRHTKTPLLAPAALLMGSFTLLVAHLSQSQPHIGGLMPVLQSPLLTIHVSVIMTAYALLGLTCVLSAIWLVKKQETLTRLSQQILLPATFLLSAGIFLGAIWAGVSWGSYWSWDPKEVWALITLLVYALPLHTHSLQLLQRPKTYHIYLLCAFLAVLFTYFGVNYLLGGMHSYA